MSENPLSPFMDEILLEEYGDCHRADKFNMRYWDAPILSTVCEPVPEALFGSSELVEFAGLLTKTMTASANGVGLAASQIGLGARVFAMRLKEGEEDKTLVMVNPYITVSSGEQVGNEGCLSLPTIYDQVKRAQKIEVNFYGPDASENTLQLADLEARIVQHEIDHLDGKMFFDRMSKNMRKHVLRQWEKIRHKYE